MSAEIQTFVSFTRTEEGVCKEYGSLLAPFADFETTLTDGAAFDTGPVPIAAATTLTIWDRANSPVLDWYVGLVWVLDGADNVIYLGWQSKESASGTHKVWDKCNLYGRAPHIFTSRNSRTNATAANHASDTTGNPTAWESGQGEEAGFIYKVTARNPGTTDLRIRAVLLG